MDSALQGPSGAAPVLKIPNPGRCGLPFWTIAYGLASLAAALPVAAAETRGAELAPSAILSAMERAADWQLANPSRPPATGWIQGAGDAGMMALAGISKDPKYRDAMRAVGEAAHWQRGPNFYS